MCYNCQKTKKPHSCTWVPTYYEWNTNWINFLTQPSGAPLHTLSKLEYWQSQEGPRRALWKFGVEMFKHYKSRSKFTVKGHVQGHTLKIYATVGKALSQGAHMSNMNVLYLRMKKLWPMLKIFKSRSKVTVKVTCSKFMVLLEGLVIRNTHAKYESPISQDKKVMPNNKVFQK